MVKTPVIPGVFNVLTLTLSGSGSGDEGSRWHTIGRLEIFGFACDTKEECNGRLINSINTYKSCSSIPIILIALTISVINN